MSNYVGVGRSNSFRVKDVVAFGDWCHRHGITVDHDEKDPHEVLIFPDDDDCGGWPTTFYNEETDEAEEFDLATELSKYLEDGQVAILVESGSEKTRYVIGWALAVNSKGETREVTINQIYELAKELGSGFGRAEYSGKPPKEEPEQQTGTGF